MFSAELLSVWIRIWFNMSLEDLPNAVAIVAKYSNSPLPVAVSVPVFHRAAVWQEKTLRWWRVEKGGGIVQSYSICCVIWGLAGVCVCLASLGSFSLFMVSVHPSLSSPTCLWTWHSTMSHLLDNMSIKWKVNSIELAHKIINAVHPQCISAGSHSIC